GQPVQELAVFVDRPAQVDRHLAAIETARLQLYFAQGFRRGALTGHVDQAAGAALAIQRGRRALEHFDAFQPVRLHDRAGPAGGDTAERQAQAVKKKGGPESTHLRIDVELRTGAVGLGQYTG